MKNKFLIVLRVFLAFFKIGLFTFGGGYAMIAVIERELVEIKKWLSHEEFLDVIAIAESSPGPIAINSATYIGYKKCGFFGSLFATLGVVLPSFIIIFVISLFFQKFAELRFVNYAFRGIQACVAFLIVSAGVKLLKKIKKTVLSVTLFCLTVTVTVLLELFAVNFSTLFIILIGGVIGLTIYLFSYFKNRDKSKTDKEKADG